MRPKFSASSPSSSFEEWRMVWFSSPSAILAATLLSSATGLPMILLTRMIIRKTAMMTAITDTAAIMPVSVFKSLKTSSLETYATAFQSLPGTSATCT